MKLSVQRDDTEELRWTCETYHYLHRWPDPRALPFGYRLLVDDQRADADGQLWGLIVMKKPQHHGQRGLFGGDGLPTAWQVLDLARVWINPSLQTEGACVFSQFVGLVLRRVQADWLVHHPPRFPDLPYHIELIISYCERQHHDGTAYRACSFERAGLTADGTKELYFRRLRRPRKAWQPVRAYQMPLFAGVPLKHTEVAK
jgi:hypothetical protein